MGQNNWRIKECIDAHRDEIVELYNQGLDILQIAERYGVSSTPIRRVLGEAKIKFRRGFEYLAAKGGPPKGAESKMWRGGRHTNKAGYVMIYAPDHPACQGCKYPRLYVLEHRLVMEQHLGRYLEPHEHVHHVDGNRANNALENLMLLTPSEHSKHHPPPPHEPGISIVEVHHCENCGQEVRRFPSQVLQHVFCSQACRYAVLAPLVSKKRWSGKGREKVTVPCEHCGKELNRWPSQIKEHNFCSVRCRSAASKGQPRGHFQTISQTEHE